MAADVTAFKEGNEMSKSIMEPRGACECYNCGDTRDLEEHHIFYGSNRKWSEHYGLKVKLCPRCHRWLKTGVHGGNQELNLRLKQEGQTIFEERWSHDLFMKSFGKSYLEVTEGTPEEAFCRR